MSFTVDFTDKDWILRSYCLDTIPSYEDHTGENIAGALQDVLENWQLTIQLDNNLKHACHLHACIL